MQIIEVKFTPWDQVYYFKPEDEAGRALSFEPGNLVIVETSLGVDLAEVIQTGELSTDEGPDKIKPIVRLASDQDRLKYLELNKDKDKIIDYCRSLIKRYNLKMKLVDVHNSFDEQRLVFAFISDGRVDFRELVKELGKKYSSSIRMQQIGVRDEAKFAGDIGPCGKPLCCQTHLDTLGNVSTDFAKCQQIAHRGTERLSGVCGRLKCCLRFEQEAYEEMSKKFPEIGSRIKTKKGPGTVLAWHTLKGTMLVNIGEKGEFNVIEVEVK